MPKTMKAVQIEKTGGTDVLQFKTDVPVPQPKEGEVLVKNEFIGKHETSRKHNCTETDASRNQLH